MLTRLAMTTPRPVVTLFSRTANSALHARWEALERQLFCLALQRRPRRLGVSPLPLAGETGAAFGGRLVAGGATLLSSPSPVGGRPGWGPTLRRCLPSFVRHGRFAGPHPSPPPTGEGAADLWCAPLSKSTGDPTCRPEIGARRARPSPPPSPTTREREPDILDLENVMPLRHAVSSLHLAGCRPANGDWQSQLVRRSRKRGWRARRSSP
jgi:hypothetical protein